MMKLFLISGAASDMMYMIYYELIGRESYHILHKTDVSYDSNDWLYVKVDQRCIGKFKDICNSYRVTIKWSNEEAA